MKHNTIDDLRFLDFVMDKILWLDNLIEPVTPLGNADQGRTEEQKLLDTSFSRERVD